MLYNICYKNGGEIIPPISKIQKEDIVNACFEIVRESDINSLNARAIAKKLNCSTQPIFYQFNNMDEIKEQLLIRIKEFFCEYLNNISDFEYIYRDIGINYIKFAEEESNLFKVLFMSKDNNISAADILSFDRRYSEIENYTNNEFGLDLEKIKKIHLKMWVFTHGLACLIVANTCKFTNEEIGNLLIEELEALLVQENVFNKSDDLSSNHN